MELFDVKRNNSVDFSSPLADRIRPRNLDEFIGQEHILGKDKSFRKIIEEDRVSSTILWGPPGTGKTTIAFIIANKSKSNFVSFSAVLSGIKDIKEVIEEAKKIFRLQKRKTILFVDEIHRFNKAQQDAFLPHVEKGLIILIGATTENPSFEVISPLLSRCQVVVLKPLTESELREIVQNALNDGERGLGKQNLLISSNALNLICQAAQGDARRALNILEIAANVIKKEESDKNKLNLKVIEDVVQSKSLLYDKSGEEHYNLISAFHKSLRGSDPDAALYWLGRMIEAGEDPLYIARRMVRFASEDIGNADPMALQVAIAAMEAFHFIGLPEGKLALAQAAIYLATSPKSNSVYTAYSRILEDIDKKGPLPVPLHIRNAPTSLMKKLGYARGYRYAHDFPDAYTPQEYLPDELKGKTYYTPSDRGFEEIIKKRLEEWRKKKKTNCQT